MYNFSHSSYFSLFYSFVDLIDFLQTLHLPESIFLCMVHKNRCNFLYDPENGLKRITSLVNDKHINDTYVVGKDLYKLALIACKLNFISNNDLKLNVLLIHFAKYYVNKTYHLFVNECKNLDELNLIERAVMQMPLNSILKGISINKKYGIKANINRFKNNHKYIKTHEFIIVQTICSTCYNEEVFLRAIDSYHIAIIESFYAIVDSKKNIINECRMLNKPTLNYTFEKFIKTSVIGNYRFWFYVPSGSIWFAYHNGKFKAQSYLNRDTENQLKRFRDHNLDSYFILGFFYNNNMYPIRFDSPTIHGDWNQIYTILRQFKFNIIFRDDLLILKDPNVTAKQYSVYFVKQYSREIFHLIKKNNL